MAKIKVKTRMEGIWVENGRAKEIKNKWIKREYAKGDILDLGLWAGEWGQIRSVEIEFEGVEKLEEKSNLTDEQVNEFLEKYKPKFLKLGKES